MGKTLMGHCTPAMSPPVALKLLEALEILLEFLAIIYILIKEMLFLKARQTKIGRKGCCFERLASQRPACPTLIFPAGAQGGSGLRDGAGRCRSGGGARLDRALLAFV